MNKKIQDAINDQIQAEMYSANLYLEMANYFESKNLSGFANWLTIQWKEETAHAVKFIKYIHSRRGVAVIKKIDQPPSDFGAPLKAFEEVLKHEKYVTGRIHKIFELAVKENDYPLQNFIQWFIDEQVEEESNAHKIIEQIKILGEKGTGLFMLDKELGGRVFK